MPSHAGEITRSYDSLWKEIRTILTVAVRFLLNYSAKRIEIVPPGSEFALSKTLYWIEQRLFWCKLRNCFATVRDVLSALGLSAITDVLANDCGSN